MSLVVLAGVRPGPARRVHQGAIVRMNRVGPGHRSSGAVLPATVPKCAHRPVKRRESPDARCRSSRRYFPRSSRNLPKTEFAFGERPVGLLLGGDVFAEDEYAVDRSFGAVPRAHLQRGRWVTPSARTKRSSSFRMISPASARCWISRQYAILGEDLIERDARRVGVFDAVVRHPTATRGEATHFAIKHRVGRRRVFNEEPQAFLAGAQRVLGLRALRDVAENDGRKYFAGDFR